MHRGARVVKAVLGILLAGIAVSPASGQDPPADRPTPGAAPEGPVELPPVEVIGATPLPALGIPRDKYPGNVQSITADDVVTPHLLDLSDMLYRRLGPVSVNGAQSNPWQNDVTYRGFLASPLTGSPSGLSVYLDGMRFNDGFGDTVHWDLIPRLEYAASYAYVDATYETDVTLASVTEAAGVRVDAGDRLPGIPRHSLKLNADVEIVKNLWVGANVLAASGAVLRGDDGNDHARLPGFAILNLQARYEPVKHLQIWARVDNVGDADYATAGAINFNALASPIGVERFVAPGAPRAVWAGVNVRF